MIDELIAMRIKERKVLYNLYSKDELIERILELEAEE